MRHKYTRDGIIGIIRNIFFVLGVAVLSRNVKRPPVRLKDVAAAAGVSSCTASRALNGTMLNKVSASTRERILDTAKAMGYKPNIMARGLAKKRTNLFGVLLPEIRASFLPKTLEGIWHKAEEAEVAVLLYATNWSTKKEEHYLKQLLDWQVDGIIWVPIAEENVVLFQEVEKTIPVVQLFTGIEKLNSSKIVLDNVEGGYLATKHLIEKGHTRIAHFAALEDYFVTAGQDRLKGYKQALEEASIPFDDRLVIDSTYTTTGGRAAFREILNIKPMPTAVFSCSDMNAWGCMQEASLLGFKIPDDLAVIGFDNIDICELLLPQLTTVEQPQRQFGELAVTMLCNALDDKPQETIILRPRVIERASC